MDLNNEIVFDVVCNDEKILYDILNWYNSNYNTDFRIIKWVGGELGFATIKAEKFYSISEIFGIGYQFGVKEESLRNKGEIDW